MKLRVPRPVWIVLPTTGLVLIVLGVNIGIPMYRQFRAIAAIERAGGWYMSNWRGPDWLCDLLGMTWNDRFGDVTDIFLDDSDCTDADLAKISTLTCVEQLSLDGCRITDTGLAHLEAMKSLQKISLDRTQVTDSGLRYLRSLPHLEGLELVDTRVTDKGLEELQQLPKLQSVSLWRTAVTDAGAYELKRGKPGMWIGR